MADKTHREVPREVKEAYQRGFQDGLRQVAMGIPNPAPSPPTAHPALSGLYAMVSRGDGHVRINSNDHGKTTWYKYRYSNGPHEGRYVLYCAKNFALPAEGLIGLQDKTVAVDERRLKTSPDVYS
jgi:hypothetical protein